MPKTPQSVCATGQCRRAGLVGRIHTDPPLVDATDADGVIAERVDDVVVVAVLDGPPGGVDRPHLAPSQARRRHCPTARIEAVSVPADRDPGGRHDPCES